ncbi:molybdate ABC transporter substrate-binding protein, partial [Sulfuracidifex metallicus]|uniref:molybdate ABC transporter substrate-binding protein n=1 Tax=Sulfuracidifex metallicus TaxID=47303 RepID=UPI0006D08A8B
VIHDIYGNLSGVKVFVAGNQWFVIEDLISKLGKVLVETLPPGVVMKQVMGEQVKIGNLVIDVKPDVVSLPPSMINQVSDLVKNKIDYVENEVVLATNVQLKDVCDLMGLKIALPNPENEGIGQIFREVYEETCGDYVSLRERSYVTKVHHRETPKLMREGMVDAGVVWKTEAIKWGFRSVGTGRKGKLSFALTKWSGKEAEEVMNFLLSEDSKKVYERYGFKWIA